jgi:hypothetical protein
VILENISSGQKKMLINDDSQPTEKRDFKSLTVTFCLGLVLDSAFRGHYESIDFIIVNSIASQ